MGETSRLCMCVRYHGDTMVLGSSRTLCRMYRSCMDGMPDVMQQRQVVDSRRHSRLAIKKRGMDGLSSFWRVRGALRNMIDNGQKSRARLKNIQWLSSK